MDLLGKSQEAEDELALAGSPAAEPALAAYEKQLAVLENKRQHWLRLDPSLSRALVSFQANKSRPVYRWFKYKEGFSADLIETLLTRHGITSGCVLDPFAGSGAGLFVAAARGLRAEGIELLPIGQQLIAARQLVEQGLDAGTLKLLRDWATQAPWLAQSQAAEVPSLRITAGAYSDVTQDGIGRYLAALASVPQPAQTILHFALLCVLENVSFTRKDGQYLRWDHRSARRQGARPFNKGHIPAFAEAIQDKLLDMLADLEQEAAGDDLFAAPAIAASAVSLHKGSCHDWLPRLADGGYSAIITSPPYCNRYDYTRTYALELALLGVDEEGLRALRQDMLSCTVENRAKDLLALKPAWAKPLGLAAAHPALQGLLAYLDDLRTNGTLNNSGIPRMVKGYFEEMACVIAECARLLAPGAPLIMVNDNVRYAGAAVPVDLILSEFAESLGLVVEHILVLPNGKGNSSQQMGAHGREALRKCVYVWRKPA